MKRTGAGILLVAAAIGFVAGFGIDVALTANGQATFTPAVMLPILLVILGGGVLALAWPIRRATRGAARSVDPFRALRVAMLAKASSILGAGVGAAALGLLAYLLTRPVGPPLGSTGTIIATAVAGAVLVAAALVAEHWCTIRKDDDDDNASGVEPGTAAGS